MLAMLVVFAYAGPAAAETSAWLPTLEVSQEPLTEVTQLAWRLAPRVRFVLERRTEYEGETLVRIGTDTRALLQLTWTFPRRKNRSTATHFMRCDAACGSSTTCSDEIFGSCERRRRLVTAMKRSPDSTPTAVPLK